MDPNHRSIAFLKEEELDSDNNITLPSQVHDIIQDSADHKGSLCYWYLYKDDRIYAYISKSSTREEEKATKVKSTKVHSGPSDKTTVPKKIRQRKNISHGDSLYFITYQEVNEVPNPSVAVLTFDDLLNEMGYDPQDEEDSQIMREMKDARLDLMTFGPDSFMDGEYESDLSVYADSHLLIDALERYPINNLADIETNALVNLYTLLSDIQQNSDDLRQSVADVLVDRLRQEGPVSGEFGSVERRTRRTKSFRDNEEVLATLERAGVDRKRVTSLDQNKVDDALDDTDLSESDVYEFEETEHVRKTEVDEEEKVNHLRNFKD